MTPEAERFLAKAARLFGEAQSMLDIGLFDAAGRAAYLTAFHAAQALVFERSGKTSKSHGGAQAEFQRIIVRGRHVDPELRAFLSRAYNLKGIADYETDPDCSVSRERASGAVATAELFLAWIVELLKKGSP